MPNLPKAITFLILIIIFFVQLDQVQAQQKTQTSLHNTPKKIETPVPAKTNKTLPQKNIKPSSTENEKGYSWKDMFDMAESFFTIIAIIAGGFWAYHKFIIRRQKHPHANLTHEIKHFSDGNEQIILHVKVHIENIGEILIQITSGFTRIQRTLPFPEDKESFIQNGKVIRDNDSKDILWPEIECIEREWKLGDFDIEPGESDEVCFDIILNSGDQAIIIYSYFENIKKSGRGWQKTSIYDLRGSC